MVYYETFTYIMFHFKYECMCVHSSLLFTSMCHNKTRNDSFNLHVVDITFVLKVLLFSNVYIAYCVRTGKYCT